jgi:hypothetical protein
VTAAARAGRLLLLVALAALAGCEPRLREPTVLATPYEHGRLWGIAPFLNESGTSIVNETTVADAFMIEAQQVDGVDVVPVNRVIFAMRELGLRAVTTPGDATSIMNLLDLDGLIVGTVTTYDPYRPMQLGMAVQLYARTQREQAGVDPRQLTRATSDTSLGAAGPPLPLAQAAGIFDAANHRTLSWLALYADARNEPESAYGSDIYLVDMDLYTRFVCYRLLHDLLESERVRIAAVASEMN